MAAAGTVRRVTERFAGLLTGTARYTADIEAPDALHLVFVRSTVAHARITDIDTSAAATAPGVAGVYRHGDVAVGPRPPMPGSPPVMTQPALAAGVVRYVGEPVVAIVAESLAEALDAAELVEIDYDPLAVVNTVDDARAAGAPRIFPDHISNAAASLPREILGSWQDGDVVVGGTFLMPRVAVAPMEPHAALAVPDGDGGLTMWVSTQGPHYVRAGLAKAVGLAPERIRVIAPNVGGGFGGKTGGGEAGHGLCAAIALQLGRPVRWIEDRFGNLVEMQGRGARQTVEAHAGTDGQLRGLRITIACDTGGYPGIGTIEPGKMKLMACGPYRVPAVDFQAESLLTNRTPTGAYRGPGRSEASTLLERCMDLLAAELDVDPVEVRRRNLLQADELPHLSVTGACFESGDPHGLLDQLLERAGYDELRREQAKLRDSGGPLLGIGIATVVDSTAWAARSESVGVNVRDDGVVEVVTGTASAGQEHGMVFVSLVQRFLPVRASDVVVIEGDTGRNPTGDGTMGSRSIQIAGTAVLNAAEEVSVKARRLAASLLEAAEDDVVLYDDRGFGVRGVPTSVIPLRDLARAASDASPDDELAARCLFDQGEPTHPSSAHLAVVEVDVETGGVTHLRHIAVTDCGEVMDPPSAHGQVIGATVQGAAEALLEHASYDEDGNPQATSLAEYLVPSAADVPPIESLFVTTPTTLNARGAKGVGEIGMLAAPAAVQNAVIDALSHLGVRHIDMPCTPEKVWRAIAGGAAG
jgi:carbon-monoxide dehydrogenase large subunit